MQSYVHPDLLGKVLFFLNDDPAIVYLVNKYERDVKIRKVEG